MSKGWREYASLHKRRERIRQRKFLVEGARFVEEALASNWPMVALFVSETFAASPSFDGMMPVLESSGVSPTILSDPNLRRLAGTEAPQGVVAVIEFRQRDLSLDSLSDYRFTLVLDAVRDPGNMGTLIRSADWFGVDLVVLCGNCVDPYNLKALRATMGSIFNIPILIEPDTVHVVEALNSANFLTIAATLDGQDLSDSVPGDEEIALILGSEAHGLSANMSEAASIQMRIPRFGKAESLNVAVAGGILMNTLAQHRKNHSK